MAKKIRELMADSESLDVLHESHSVFRREQDEQLVQWMNRSLRHGRRAGRGVAGTHALLPRADVHFAFVLGGQTTGPFLPAAVALCTAGDITTGDSLGASKVQKSKSPPRARPWRRSGRRN